MYTQRNISIPTVKRIRISKKLENTRGKKCNYQVHNNSPTLPKTTNDAIQIKGSRIFQIPQPDVDSFILNVFTVDMLIKASVINIYLYSVTLDFKTLILSNSIV
ncbi:unnamed protein product [Trichobilharzia regenti]|nr:unnamed protein product [Trichobilharzia regenti]